MNRFKPFKTVQIPQEEPIRSVKASPLPMFDRSFVPPDEEARKSREFMLGLFDLGIERHAYALALAQQEARHQMQELLALRFGKIGVRQFLIELLLSAHLGDQQAMHDWMELAKYAAVHLRDDCILGDMQKAVNALAVVLKHKHGDKDRARFLASFYALTWKQDKGAFPTKAQVARHLRKMKVPLPEEKNMTRFWKGAILGRLKNAKAGRKPQKKKSPSRGKIR